MRFEELASRAVTRVGERAERPVFAHVLDKHHSRTLIMGWSMATASVAVVFALVLLWPDPDLESPPADVGTTTTLATATTTSPDTTVPGVVADDRESCRVTVPEEGAFTPESEAPEGPPPLYEAVWYGTPELWTMVQHGGEIWVNLPVAADGTLTQKAFWWTEDYDSISKPEPEIVVTLEPLDGSADVVAAGPVTNAGHPELGVFVIAALQIPEEGCWRVIAEYGEAALSYIAWVGDE